MSRGIEQTRIAELRQALSQTDRTAYLVEPRVIRRVIRERFGFARLTANIPHSESQVVPAVDVRFLVHPDELGLTSFADLPAVCLLICQPDENELEHWPLPELLQQVWRRLFHAQIDRTLLTLPSIRRADIQERIAQTGQVEFDEAHFVLRNEHRLIEPESRTEAWREFVATWAELQRFEPDLLAAWFPSLADRPHVADVVRRDIDLDRMFAASRLPGAPDPDLTPHAEADEDRLVRTRRDWSLAIGNAPSDRAWLRQLRRRDRANERGNTVAAIVSAIRAVQRATSDDKRTAAQEKARADVKYLVERLRRAIEFPEEQVADWQASLWELATNSVHGFWNSEKRLLYDLQKVCLDHERVNYRVDLVKWIVSRGRRPLRRPLTNLREVMMAKHLASSAARLVDVRLSGNDRERLAELLHGAAHLAELQMRQRTRPLLKATLADVGVDPQSVPEQVAFDKLVEDALDCIADRGYLTMGYLRDAFSKNDLKVPDLRRVSELFRGDLLLRADDRLDVALDGIYRRGDFYLRWLQIVSSVFFGTPVGRFATLYLLIPFGGALVIVEGVLHVVKLFRSLPDAGKSEVADDSAADDSTTNEAAGAEIESPPVDPVAGDQESGEADADVGTVPASESADQQTTADAEPVASGTKEVIAVPPRSTDEAMDQVVARQLETASWVLIVGLLLMGLIHVAEFRRRFFKLMTNGIRLLRKVFIVLPQKLLKLPIVQRVWKHRVFVQIRRLFCVPAVSSVVIVRLIPALLLGVRLSWWWVGTVGVLFSFAWNSRLGQDTQELTAEWLGNAWYKLRARVVMAVLDWVIDVFRTILSFIERFLYAVDEWLRFHSDESWLSIVAKACLGVLWSAVSFLIRIYINLLIEPTLHPVKHFPVVTVAHKMFLPVITILGTYMLNLFTPYMGAPLAGLFTGFNIFFLPGIFGFLVWELKENWRLYQANRQPALSPIAVGSHGETVARLLRPGFHSGTLPKLFRRLRRLEHQPSSLRRFTARRAGRLQLEHVEEAIRNFVERELIRLLQLCPVWSQLDVTCGHIHAASNSFAVDLDCVQLGPHPVQLLFQEQSGWVAASVPQQGWLASASREQRLSFKNALAGFYRKSGIDLVREQIEQHLTATHEYDINTEGLAIWPNGMFSHELQVDLERPGLLRALPASEAAAAGFMPVERAAVVFSDSATTWTDWEELWSPKASLTSDRSLPPACLNEPAIPVLNDRDVLRT